MPSPKKPSRGAAPPTNGRLSIWLLLPFALLPALLLTTLSLSQPWFTNRAEPVYQWIVTWLAILSLGGGAALLWTPLRERCAARLDEIGALPPRLHRLWLAIVYAGIYGFFFFLEYCQYRGFQLPRDTAVVSNLAYNFLHGFGSENSIYGVNHYAIHFQPLNALYAPFLLIANSTLALLAAQCAVLCTAPIAVYGLIFHRTRSSSTALAGLWLCLSSPFMFQIASNNLEAPVNLAAFFLWALLFAERRRPLPAAAFFVLAAMCSEQTPLAFIGLGLYLFFSTDHPRPKARAWGLAICVGSMVLFGAEMSVINSFPKADRIRDWSVIYGHLGATPSAALAAALGHPLTTLKIVAWPLSKLEPLGRILWTTGFFCVLLPPAIPAWLLNYIPSFLAAPGTTMSLLYLHYAAQTVGPVWWAMAGGLSFVFLRLAASERTTLLLPWALLIGAWNMSHGPRILIKDWRPSYFTEGPAAAAVVPPDASVWTSEFLSPWLGCRSRIKILGPTEDVLLLRRGFMPDYIVLSKDWFSAADEDLRRKVAALVTREAYDRVLNSPNFIAFKHPRYPLPVSADAAPFELPQPMKDIDFRAHVVP